MATDIQTFNSQEAAKILGVNVSTIKRWTEEGKLECVKTAGGHRKFMMQHLSGFLKQNKKKNSRVNLFPLENETDLKISHYILRGDFEYLTDFVEDQAFACNRDQIQQVLNGLYLGQYPLHEIFDRLITPIMYRIGERWQQNEIAISEEHLASQTIRDSMIRLQGIIRVPRRKTGTALCLSFSTELHDMALKMIDHILESRGFKVLFSGQITPILKIENVFDKLRPDRVYISSTYIGDVETTQKEFDELCRISDAYGADVFIGGGGFDSLITDRPGVVKRLHSFRDVATY
ncbi:MAG TPA: excisionase family DNA-binding protein [Calditrichia bacterium]|nr:excisionase family DNA-binding protein [Calditrichota bacterium]HQV30285.1 excisionase family DNA-binding protein [Calditrichia bacterium]